MNEFISIDEAAKLLNVSDGYVAKALRERAERRLGELMAEARDAGRMATGGKPYQQSQGKSTGGNFPPVPKETTFSKPPTLSEQGIDKNLAKVANKLAAMPSDDFERCVAIANTDTTTTEGQSPMTDNTAARAAAVALRDANARRQRLCRQRRHSGRAPFFIEIDVGSAADALLSLGLLDEAHVANRAMIGRALARFVASRLRPVA
jgi:hypothetical protein